jgi:hypothetical protein
MAIKIKLIKNPNDPRSSGEIWGISAKLGDEISLPDCLAIPMIQELYAKLIPPEVFPGRRAALELIMGDGVNEIPTGEKGHLFAPFPGMIKRVRIITDQAGDLVIDIWKRHSDDIPPLPQGTDSICNSHKPTLSSNIIMEDDVLEGWGKDVDERDIFAINVDSCTTITRATLSIEYEV